MRRASFFRIIRSRYFQLAALLFVSLSPLASYSQGWGVSKTEVTLRRKLPSIIRLTNTTISVKGSARSQQQAESAQLIGAMLQTQLLKYDHTLTVDKNSPNVTVNLTITDLQTPQRQTFTRDETDIQKNGKPMVVKKTVYKYIGSISVDMVATDRSGRTLDANNFTAKYSREFDQSQNGGGVVGGAETGANAAVNTFGIVKRKLKPNSSSDDSSDAPPTEAQIRQHLEEQIVDQIAPRMVNTDEKVEVPLARGKLDDADKLAVGGLWNRDLETLEQMPPMGGSNNQDDSYRQYNIGVANEALGYQAEDRASATKFFEDAAIGYGKAIDAKPSEKNFIAAQTRIETAVAYYKKLGDRATMPMAASTGPATSAPTKAAGTPSTTTSRSTRSGTTQPASSTPTSKPTVSRSSSALTNAKVIQMFKAGVDEQSIIAAIQAAKATNFDLSADGLIDLANNGVKGKIVDAMRARSHSARGASSASGNGRGN